MSNIENMRASALRLFDAGVAAADPFHAVSEALEASPAPQGSTLISVGKAAVRMAEAALATGFSPAEVIVVTNPENARDVAEAKVFAAAHPVPDEVSLEAGEAVIGALEREQKHVLALISGGGSALMVAPADGLALRDKIAVNELLLASGADITEMNLVRQNLSQLKGGGMAQRAAPARVRTLILSDVVGDDLSAIASGPTVAPLGDRARAAEICRERGLWDELPNTVRAHLSAPVEADPVPKAKNVLIGSNFVSVMAMANVAKALERPLHIHTPPLTGDVDEAARRVAGVTDKGIHLFGGETTVRLKGTGKGGRNQELALRVALYLEHGRRDWVYLQGGTDGRDGPTDAAGGFVDAARLSDMRRAVDVEAMLDNNDAYEVLKAGDGLLMTGGTGTNVADLGILIID